MMALDDVVNPQTPKPRIEEAMYRTIRWIDRCIAAHKRPHEQVSNLHFSCKILNLQH